LPLPGQKAAPLRVLGIDTSLRGTGIGVVEQQAGRIRGLAYDVLRNPPARPLSDCLVHIQNSLNAILDEFHPDVVAVEGVFFSRYVKTTLILGEARGVVIATCAAAGLPIYEYAPRRVKQAVVGYGAATKQQIQAMVVQQLGLGKPPPEDAADALAIALCHLHNQTRLTLEDVKRL
jgi:crossover junction endodeoxyribonuclease RuvC